MRKIKVAIIGAGQIAQTTHIPAFKSMENVEIVGAVSYTHLRAHETRHDLVCRLLLEKKKEIKKNTEHRKQKGTKE